MARADRIRCSQPDSALQGRWFIDIDGLPFITPDGQPAPDGWVRWPNELLRERCTFATREEAEEAYAKYLLLQEATN